MSTLDLSYLNKLSLKNQVLELNQINILWKNFNINQRIDWIFEKLPKNIVMSSSFGLHSVVLLHLLVTADPNIPVIFIDTGYLFLETYQYVDLLTKALNLNIKIFRSRLSPAWQECRYGKLWEQGVSGLEKYNYINKIKPMKTALSELMAQSWLSGLRYDQSKFRANLKYISIQNNIFKVLPIIDWSVEKLKKYISKNNLLSHPLTNNGYVSLGDIHTTHKYVSGMSSDDTRFFGLQRECGLHNK
ncbi:MAG: phosphoadenylyl-sulfate reductase [Buchnera aphidicola (Eriosoma harunire)]